MNFLSFSGVVTSISDFNVAAEHAGCFKLMAVNDGHGSTVNFIVEPTTYFVDHAMVVAGDRVTGFYDADAPVPLIYPPQYRSLVMAKDSPYRNVKVSFFNEDYVSGDGQLKLNFSPTTQLLLENGQAFTRSPANRNLIVVYGATTRSIPAQTTPFQIIVMC
ncbi:hypothetical protein ACFOZY_12350 [Chungangia koreensis]|uniref:Uncharacterized protein n=1 Tax=Chungangia koreensis TaxID=752657 RepID=A0ABV8X5N3_9LACT